METKLKGMIIKDKPPVIGKCKLCQVNDADQTGSHILSCVSLKSMIGERGEEKGYLISSNPLQNYRENTGAEEVKQHYILCRSCEQRLGYVEGYTAEELFNKIKIDTFKENFISDDLAEKGVINCKRLDPFAFHLFLYSLVWRASISSNQLFNDFNLTTETEEELRSILNKLLPERKDYRGVVVKKRDWFKYLSENAALFDKFQYIILTPPTIVDRTGDFVIFHPEYSNPYGIILNEWIIYFDVVSSASQDMFGLLPKFNTPSYLNSGSQKIRIGLVDNDKWEEIRQNLIELVKNQKIKNLFSYFEEEFVMKYGYQPSKRILYQLVIRFIENMSRN